MNCADFEDQLMEYMEGSLPTQTRAIAEEHLAGCESCREAVRREERVARVLSEGLHASVVQVELSSETKRKIRSRLAEKPKLWGGFFDGWQIRWAMGAAATALIVAGIYLTSGTDGYKSAPKMTTRKTEITLVQVAYELPVQVFHRDGNRVVDTFAYQQVAVNATLDSGNR